MYGMIPFLFLKCIIYPQKKDKESIQSDNNGYLKGKTMDD